MLSSNVDPGSRLSLLIVDDEPMVLSLLSRFASQNGFSVVLRDGRSDVITELPALQPDVALVDLHLPTTSGLDVLRALRKARSNCHVIVMTGAASIDTAIEAVRLGALDYLTKPIQLDRLGTQLTQARYEVERRRRLLKGGAQDGRLREHRLYCEGCKRPITVLIEPATLSEIYAPARAQRWPCPHCGFGLEWLLKATVRGVWAGHTVSVRCQSCGQDMSAVLDAASPAAQGPAGRGPVPASLASTYHRCPVHGLVQVSANGQQQVVGHPAE